MTTTTTTTHFAGKKITQVYFGGDRVCRCGCAGEYFMPEEEGFARNVARFNRLAAKGAEVEVTEVYANIVTGKDRHSGGRGYGKAITIYFDER
jgi:hypothetical protein